MSAPMSSITDWIALGLIFLGFIGFGLFWWFATNRMKSKGVSCIKCGHPMDLNDKICPNCGFDMEQFAAGFEAFSRKGYSSGSG